MVGCRSAVATLDNQTKDKKMVRKLDREHDWTFGRGKANYIRGQAEILQNVKTRIQSFANDWMYDIDANIDWINLLGSFNKKAEIEREVKRVTLATDGVVAIREFGIIIKNREATINMTIDTIFSESVALTVEVA